MTFAIARRPPHPHMAPPSVNPFEGQPLSIPWDLVGLPLDPLGWDLPKLI